MKKIIYLLICILPILSAGCSDNSDDDDIGVAPPGEKEEIPEPILIVSSDQIGLFELTNIGIRLKNSDSYNFDFGSSLGASLVLSSYYDSLVWNIKNIMSHTSTPNSSRISMGQSFILPGEYKIYIDGYIDGEVYSTDTTIVYVGAAKDFLSIRWSEDNTEKEFFNFLNPALNYFIDLKYYSETDPHAILTCRPYEYGGKYGDEEFLSILKSTREYLYNYITGLYGEPLLSYEGEDLGQASFENEYDARFKTPLNEHERDGIYFKDVPLVIWETPRTYICLLASLYDSTEPEITFYKIIAEPRK